MFYMFVFTLVVFSFILGGVSSLYLMRWYNNYKFNKVKSSLINLGYTVEDATTDSSRPILHLSKPVIKHTLH